MENYSKPDKLEENKPIFNEDLSPYIEYINEISSFEVMQHDLELLKLRTTKSKIEEELQNELFQRTQKLKSQVENGTLKEEDYFKGLKQSCKKLQSQIFLVGKKEGFPEDTITDVITQVEQGDYIDEETADSTILDTPSSFHKLIKHFDILNTEISRYEEDEASEKFEELDKDVQSTIQQVQLALDEARRIIIDSDRMRVFESSTHENFGDHSYWEKSYQTMKEQYNWYFDYPVLKELLSEFSDREAPILMVGCGNSTLSEEMVKDDFKKVVNIDFSKVVIDIMLQKAKNQGLEEKLDYLVMDATKMEFEDSKFKYVLDKGTIDAILCAMDGEEKATKVCQEITRVLKPGGIFLLFSCMPATFILKVVAKKEYRWKIRAQKIGEKKEVLFLVMRKDSEQ